jgi:uncharacterized protein
MTTIVHNAAASRFEASVQGQLCVLDYQRRDGVLVMPHTSVPPALRGRGIAEKLVRTVLEWARVEGLKVVPRCSYVAAYMRRHRETQDLRTSE